MVQPNSAASDRLTLPSPPPAEAVSPVNEQSTNVASEKFRSAAPRPSPEAVSSVKTQLAMVGLPTALNNPAQSLLIPPPLALPPVIVNPSSTAVESAPLP